MIYSIKRWKKVKNNGLILLFVDFQRDQWNKSIGGKVQLYVFFNREKIKMKQPFYFSTVSNFQKTLNDLNVYVRLWVTWEKYDPKSWHLYDMLFGRIRTWCVFWLLYFVLPNVLHVYWPIVIATILLQFYWNALACHS